MDLSGVSLNVALFGAASLIATVLGALITKGWRSKVLWGLAVVVLALVVARIGWPRLSPILTAIWVSNGLVVLLPVVVVALMREPPAPKPPPPPFPIAPVIPRPKPRLRQPRSGEAKAQ
jgi:predicted MFS family arabinose efflux permease